MVWKRVQYGGPYEGQKPQAKVCGQDDSITPGIQADGRALLNCRLRLLREEPHTQKTAEAAVGLGTDNGKRSQEPELAMED